METPELNQEAGGASAAPAMNKETASAGKELPNPVVMVIGHLQMLALAAKREYKPKRPDEIDDRVRAIMAFLRTGQLLPTEEDMEMLEILKKVFSDAMIQPLAIAGD